MTSNPSYADDLDTDQLGDGSMKPSKHQDPVVVQNGDSAGPPKPKEGFSPEPDLHEQEQKKRERNPVWFCKQICNWPKTSFGVTLGLHILMLLITGVLLAAGYDILPISFDDVPLDLQSDTDFLRDQAWMYRDQSSNFIAHDAISSVQAERSQVADDFYILFEIKDGNVLTEDNLKQMEIMEDKYWGMTENQNTYCQLDASNQCIKPRSLIRYFDGTFSAVDPVIFKDYGSGDSRYSNYVQVMYTAYTNDATKRLFQFFLGADAQITSSSVSTSITRLTFAYGFPLEGYKNVTDNEDEQEDKLREFLRDTVYPLGEDDFKDGAGEMDFAYFVSILLSPVITAQVTQDMLLAVGSMLFIVIFMCVQTGSLFITGLTVFSIITGFCTANLIYRIVFDYIYFGIFHILAIFIILGIGADDVFVFMDTWKETGHHRYPTLGHRMSDAYRKASMAMLFTSLTTAMAFVVSAASPFLAIRSFGLFSAVLILVNYLSVILFLPCVVVVYHLYFEKYKCCCCCPNNQTIPSDVEDGGPDWPEGGHQEKKSAVVRFFAGPYFKFVTHKIARWIILVFYAALVGTSIYFATELEVNDEQVKFLPSSNNFGRYINTASDSFLTSGDSPTTVTIAWGLKEQDMGDCHKTNYTCEGATQYDDTFSLNTDAAQNALKDLCSEIRNLSPSQVEKLAIQLDPVTGLPVIECFIEVMDDFYTTEENRMVGSSRRYPTGTNLNSPWSKTDAQSIMTSNPSVYTEDLTEQTGFLRYFEVALSFWLYNGFVPGEFSSQLDDYGETQGEVKASPYTTSTDVSLNGYTGTETNSGNTQNLLPSTEDSVAHSSVPMVTPVGSFVTTTGPLVTAAGPLVTTAGPLETTAVPLVTTAGPLGTTAGPLVTTAGPLETTVVPLVTTAVPMETTRADMGTSQTLENDTAATTEGVLDGDTFTYWYGTRMIYASIQVTLSVNSQTLGFQEGLPIRDEWEDFVSEKMENMPAGLKKGFQTSEGVWHWCKVQEELARSAFSGIIIGLCLAFPILVIATSNIIVGLLATLTIVLITVSVLGVIPLAGWKLGVLESLNLVLVVGLAVDYVVHLAEGYSRSVCTDRKGRLKDTLEEVGISVLSGACTTLGASAFLLLAVILFFQQFGIFMFSTIGFSVLYALGLFPTVLGLIGPQNEFGSLKPLYRWCAKNCCKKCSSKDKDTDVDVVEK